MAITNEDLLKELSAKPIMEVVELIKLLEEEWGVSAAAPVAVAAAPGADAGGAAEEEKTEFDVVMSSFGENKVSVIKAVRKDIPEIIVNRPPIRPVMVLGEWFPKLGEWIVRKSSNSFLRKVAQSRRRADDAA